jgi:hypothetical protein
MIAIRKCGDDKRNKSARSRLRVQASHSSDHAFGGRRAAQA